MNKIAIVTGANSGIGFETAKALANQNTHVIMACRNMEKARFAKENILTYKPNASLEIIPLDLGDFNSIHNFFSEFEKKYSKLDLLINNAGIMNFQLDYTQNGIEQNFGTNYVGHFLLTNLLFPIISESENARIVSLASIAHKYIKKAITSKEAINTLKGFSAYSNSKLACLSFAYELQKRLEETNNSTISVVAHPGVSITNIGQRLPNFALGVQDKFGQLIFSSQQQGAEATLYAATNKNVFGGEYFGPGGLLEFKGKVKEVKSSKLSKDPNFADILWKMTEELTGNKFEVK